MRLLRAALAASALMSTAASAGCADAHATAVRAPLTQAEVEARQHLDTVIARHLSRIRAEMETRQAAVATR